MKEYIVQAIAQETIDSFDAHNAPELVRCKDCKHFFLKDARCFNKKSPCRERMTSPDWFCADGVKKDD